MARWLVTRMRHPDELIGAMVRVCREKFPDLEWSDIEPILRRLWTESAHAPRWDRIRDTAYRRWCRANCGSRSQPVMTVSPSFALH